jgi:hypothetical protein
VIIQPGPGQQIYGDLCTWQGDRVMVGHREDKIFKFYIPDDGL